MCSQCVSAHHTYVDILKDYHGSSVSKVIGYTMIRFDNIRSLKLVDALVLRSAICSIPEIA